MAYVSTSLEIVRMIEEDSRVIPEYDHLGHSDKALKQEEMEALLLDGSFYLGQSHHPIHQAMKLPFGIIKIAHLSCRPLNIYLARCGKFDQIVFTNEEEHRFARSIIFANKFLSSNGFLALPLIHLTPRMLLDFRIPPLTVQPSEESEPSKATRINIELVEEEELASNDQFDNVLKKSRRKKNHRKKSINTNNNIHSHSADDSQHIQTTSSPQPPKIQHFDHHDEFATSVDNISTPMIESLHIDVVSSPNIRHEEEVEEAARESIQRKKHNFDKFSIAHKNEYRQLIDHLPIDYHGVLYEASQMFEDYITDIREQYEESLQTLNMRLYLANNSLEVMTENFNKLQSSVR
jgi:hypothetical protein